MTRLVLNSIMYEEVEAWLRFGYLLIYKLFTAVRHTPSLSYVVLPTRGVGFEYVIFLPSSILV